MVKTANYVKLRQYNFLSGDIGSPMAFGFWRVVLSKPLQVDIEAGYGQ